MRDEQFPLAPIDDLMIHQTLDPVRVMWTSDPRAYERYWTCFGCRDGSLAVALGGSFYPNLDVAEAFAIVNAAGRHTAIRAGRRLGADRTDLAVGPLRPTIEDGLRRWRYRLEPNEWGITFDLLWHDEKRQRARIPGFSSYRTGYPSGRPAPMTAGFEGFGSIEGWIEIDSRRATLHREDCRGARDRHWGVRPNVGGRAQLLGGRPYPGVQGGQYVDFGDWALWHDQLMYPFDADPRQPLTVADSRHRVRFEEGTRIFAEAIVDNVLPDGTVRRLHYRRCGEHQTVFLRAGGYGGPNGGTPDGDHWEGERIGSQLPYLEGEHLDSRDPDVRSEVAGLDQHLCTVTWGERTAVGFYQTYDPLAYERCAGQDARWSFL